MNDKNKLSYILSLYYRWEFIEIVERISDDGDSIIKETILERDFRKNLHELNYKELFKRNLYVIEILSTIDDFGTRTILVVREDKTVNHIHVIAKEKY